MVATSDGKLCSAGGDSEEHAWLEFEYLKLSYLEERESSFADEDMCSI